jgi:hypothetical protein
MDTDETRLKEYALFHINRKVVNLYKQLLFVLEDVRDEKYNIQDDRIYQITRKRILDLGNDTIREIEEHFKFLELNVKNEYRECHQTKIKPSEHAKGAGGI